MHGHVVLGVTRGVHGHQHPVGPDDDLLPVGQDVQPIGRRRVEPSVERVEQRAVDPGRRVDQPGGVGQVAGPLLVDVHRGPGEGPGHVAHTAGVVEVDVGDHHPGQVRGAHPEGVQRRQQDGHRGLAARLDQDRGRPVHRYPAVIRVHPPSRVSISRTPAAISVAAVRVRGPVIGRPTAGRPRRAVGRRRMATARGVPPSASRSRRSGSPGRPSGRERLRRLVQPAGGVDRGHTWEKAWGKLPTSRPATGSYSSDSSPRSLRRPSSRSNMARASSSGRSCAGSRPARTSRPRTRPHGRSARPPSPASDVR